MRVSKDGSKPSLEQTRRNAIRSFFCGHSKAYATGTYGRYNSLFGPVTITDFHCPTCNRVFTENVPGIR